jgi:histidinol dehydrogenase
MAVRLRAEAPDFETRFHELLSLKRESAPEVDEAVAGILADVRARGDAALIDLTARYDRLQLDADTLAVSPEEIAAAAASVPPEEVRALELAAERIEAYHARQKPQDQRFTDAAGAELGWRWSAVDAAGLYVPGGLASYPSSLLMNAIPAKAAGVRRLAVCMPTPDGRANPLVLLAAKLSGVTEVFRIGGAQAIAAMAYGTETVRPVDKIVGPGNAYVAAAKRRVFGTVGIDMIAGPSEILVIADAGQNPEWIAMDLMSQAEHDESAQAILVTDSPSLAQAVIAEVEGLLTRLERSEIAGASWRANGAVIVVRDMAEAAEIADRVAPEHLEICTEDPEAVASRIRHAGAIFLGAWTPEAIGDYVGGPNHGLPT